MSDDNEDISLYLYALAATGVIVASIWLLTPQQIEVARFSANAVDTGAIETANIAVPAEEREPAGWNTEEIPWRSYEDGKRRMAETGKPGLLVLDAEWCLVCRSYEKLFHKKEITQFADDYIFIIADVEKEPAIQQRYNVDGDYIPRTFLLNPDGTLAQDSTGGHQRQRFFVDPFRSDELLELLNAPR